MKNKFNLILLFILFNFSTSFSQVTHKDSILTISKLSYETLGKYIYDLRRTPLKSVIYGEAFLFKAKSEGDESREAQAYYGLATMYKSNKALTYADSAITIANKIKDFNRLVKTYLYKANVYGHLSNYNNQMDMLAKANKYANITGDLDRQNQIKYNIALLKGNLEDHEESKKLHKEVLDYYQNKHSENVRYEQYYITSLFAYGDALNSLKKLDSAQIINKTAIKLSLNRKDSLMYDRLLLSSAVTHHQKKEYQSSLDSIKKFKDYYTVENSSLGMIVTANAYLAKNHLRLNNRKYAENYLLKTDSLIFSDNYFYPSFRENQELLVQFYRDEKNIKKQLYFIDRLLTVDSILDRNVKYLSKHINEDYTTPNLILEKERIIKSLEKNNINKTLTLTTLSVFSILLITILYRNNEKKKIYKRRIEELSLKKKAQNYTVNNETTKRILEELSKVEESQQFLDKNFNLNVLSKLLKTNTSYLSKVINEHKGKTFKQYLIELRIKTLIKNLDEDPVMRKYSIEALAESIGYTNASSFTRIFKNYLGESPSSFLKKRYSG